MKEIKFTKIVILLLFVGIILILKLGVFKNKIYIQYKPYYLTSINEDNCLKHDSSIIKTLSKSEYNMIMSNANITIESGFNNDQIEIFQNDSKIFDASVKTDLSTDWTGKSINIPKIKNNKIKIIMNHLYILEFVPDTNYRTIRLNYSKEDNLSVSYTKCIFFYYD